MGTIRYEDDAVQGLVSTYLGPDIVAQRADTLKHLAIKPGEAVLDIGSGPGFLAKEIALQTGGGGSVVGIYISRQMVDFATGDKDCSWLTYQQADATDLPFDDVSFDVVVSTQVAEYVSDIAGFCAEVHRVLKPGGRGLIMATDWGGVIWHSENPKRMQQVLAAFTPHSANQNLPRTLGARLRQAGLTLDTVSYFPIINVDRYEGCYSERMITLMRPILLEAGDVDAQTLQAWEQELVDLNARGEHFFASGRFSFHVSKGT